MFRSYGVKTDAQGGKGARVVHDLGQAGMQASADASGAHQEMARRP